MTKIDRKLFISRKLKYLLMSTGTLVLLLLSLIIWIYFALFSGPGAMELNEYHPFRSLQAKESYLKFEAEMGKKWPLKSDERLVETSFGKTFMRISGPIDAPPLVLLPGGGCNSTIWHTNIKALSDSFRTYALDNIYDYGQSIYSREVKSGNDFADWLDELFDTLKLDNTIKIIGYSYGGWVTSQYAKYYPERLSHVVFIAPVFILFPLPSDFTKRMLLSLIPIRHFKSEVIYWSWSDLAQSGSKGIQLVEDRIDHFAIALKSFKFKRPVNPTLLSESELGNLDMPILFLVGENEAMYNCSDAIRRFNEVNPKIQAKCIKNTGHDLMFTHTEVLNRMIINFLIK